MTIMSESTTQLHYYGFHLGLSKPYMKYLSIRKLRQTLIEIKSINANSIALPAYLYIKNVKAVKIKVPDEVELKTLDQAIFHAQNLGFKVMLNVILIVMSGNERSEVKPKNVTKWFKFYSDGLLEYVEIAEKRGVPLICIGSNLKYLEKYSKHWKELIEKLRSTYHGQLTYGLKWWATNGDFNLLLKCEWLKDLDYIGVNAYFPLIDKEELNLNDIVGSWYKNLNGRNVIEELRILVNKYGRNIILTEIGYRSIVNSLKNPENSKIDGNYSEDVQALAYEALFNVFLNQTWLKGIFIREWTIGYSPKPNDKSYNVKGKKSEDLIRKVFSKLKALG